MISKKGVRQMKIIIDTPANIAKRAAQRYEHLLKEKPDAVLGLATGSTPLGLYEQLVELHKSGRISFARSTTFNLDEYMGLDVCHEQSYNYFMHVNLLSHIDIPRENIHIPSGLDTSNGTLKWYEDEIERVGGIDLQLLGLGVNGHIGFNEPYTPFNSLTHVVSLTQETRQANARFFGCLEDVPHQAVTMGIKTVMKARSIILMALGKGKAKAIFDTLKGNITPLVPASILQLHPFLEIYLDEDAASML
jgi:glucosamine-6-phosphate deaminase